MKPENVTRVIKIANNLRELDRVLGIVKQDCVKPNRVNRIDFGGFQFTGNGDSRFAEFPNINKAAQTLLDTAKLTMITAIEIEIKKLTKELETL